MDLLASKKEFCYCAFCRSPRRIYSRRRVGFFHVLVNAFGAALFSVLFFAHLDPRAVLIFILLLGTTEIFLQLRRRVSLICQSCGFDPLLYLRDSKKAVEKVQQTLDERQQDPLRILAEPLGMAVRREKRRSPTSASKSEDPGLMNR